MKNNNTHWEVGDIAICIDASGRNGFGENPPLHKWSEYKVNGLNKCPICGENLIDIGFYSKTGTSRCGDTTNTYPNNHIWWLSSFRFIKKYDNELSETSLEELINPTKLQPNE